MASSTTAWSDNATAGMFNTTETMNTTIAMTTQGSSDGGSGRTMYFPWSNPDNIMTKETSDDITTALQCYVFPILTLIGLSGNVMSLVVLLHKQLRNSSTSIVLVGLAVSDSVFLITNAIRKSSCIVKRYDAMAADTLTATTFFYMFYLKTAFSRVSTLIVVLISTERLIAVAFPLKVKSIITKSRMAIAVIFCYVITLAGLGALPPQYTYTYIRGKPYISQTPFAKMNAPALKIYNEYFLPIAFRHIPVLLVLFMNTAIVVILRRSKRFQKNATRQDSKRADDQKKITRMLLSVAIVFLVCLLPGDVLLITSTLIDGFEFFGTYHNLFMALSDMCLSFEMINSCINFLIYMLLNKNFYDTYTKIFCCCLHYVRSRDSSSSGSRISQKTADTAISMGNTVMSDVIGETSKVAENTDTESGIVLSIGSNGQVNEAFVE